MATRGGARSSDRVDIINRKLGQQAGTVDDAVDEKARVASAVAAALSDLLPLDRYARALSRLRKMLRSLKEWGHGVASTNLPGDGAG